jgi:hypothetical protein
MTEYPKLHPPNLRHGISRKPYPSPQLEFLGKWSSVIGAGCSSLPIICVDSPQYFFDRERR